MHHFERLKLGDVLLEAQLITTSQWHEALEKQTKTGKGIDEILIKEGNVTEESILQILEEKLGVPYIDLNKETIAVKAATMISKQMAQRYGLIPVNMKENMLQVAMSDPLNFFAIEDIKLKTKMEVIPRVSTNMSIQRVIEEIFASTQTQDIVDEVEKQIKADLAHKNLTDSMQQIKAQQVDNDLTIRLVDHIIDQALLKDASDIHIEPFEKELKVRYRIDGQLQEMIVLPKEALNGIVTRIKILAKMNIAERRLPQDGRISKKTDKGEIDLRISTLPTIYGEKTMIRVIDSKGLQLQINHLGFHPEDLVKFKKIIQRPHGILLMTGPTGSGKSTTLASILRELNKSHINITTVEDPVENTIEGISQVAVNVKAGLTFGTALRSILRQDPDVLMIGEIRDSETSSIAIRAAITGHLVLSTLHTHDAASSVTRLIDMGAEAFMVGTALSGVIAQRLVRKVCKECRKEHRVTGEESKLYKIDEGTIVYQGEGCPNCYYTGYKGRIAVHEIFVVDSEIQDIISSKSITAKKLKEIAIQKGMRSLKENILYQVIQGHTTLEEMGKIVYEY